MNIGRISRMDSRRICAHLSKPHGLLYAAGVRCVFREEPKDDETHEEYHFIYRTTPAEQFQMCSDYLDKVGGWERYNEAKGATKLGIVDYCWKLHGFWDWLNG